MELIRENLQAILPNMTDKAVDVFLPHLRTFFPSYLITTPQRIGAFLAQVGHESEDFRFVIEQASGSAYENRADLGNIYPGDGPKFKGRGLIQITGRTNYRHCSQGLFKDFRLEQSSGLLATPQYAVQSACWFWNGIGLNEVCDQPEDWIKPGPHHYSKFEYITVKINGGLNGILSRQENYDRARKVFSF